MKTAAELATASATASATERLGQPASHSAAQPIEPPVESSAALEADLPPGKRKLIEAALRLTAGGRSFATLGLRELAREAALNPNTFYRHFDTLDDLAREAVEWVSRRLRPMLRRERWLAAHGEPRRACAAFFSFALENREAFLSALGEYHGTSPVLREAVRANLHEVSAEMADDVVQLNLMPALARETVDEVCTQIVLQLFHLSQEYIAGHAEHREALVDYAERFVVRLFAGSTWLAQHEAAREWATAAKI